MHNIVRVTTPRVSRQVHGGNVREDSLVCRRARFGNDISPDGWRLCHERHSTECQCVSTSRCCLCRDGAVSIARRRPRPMVTLTRKLCTSYDGARWRGSRAAMLGIVLPGGGRNAGSVPIPCRNAPTSKSINDFPMTPPCRSLIGAPICQYQLSVPSLLNRYAGRRQRATMTMTCAATKPSVTSICRL